MARFELTEAAAADLAQITAYTTSRWGPAQTAKYLDALEARLAQLARRPAMGRQRDELAKGLLSFPFESHVAYYVPTRFGISVWRVLHQRQDPHRHIGEERHQ